MNGKAVLELRLSDDYQNIWNKKIFKALKIKKSVQIRNKGKKLVSVD